MTDAQSETRAITDSAVRRIGDKIEIQSRDNQAPSRIAWITAPKRLIGETNRGFSSRTSVKDPQYVGYEQDQQYGAQSYARTAPITPAAVTVESSTTTQNQYQDDDQYQHGIFLSSARRLFLKHLFNLSQFLLDLACELFILAFGRQVGIVCQFAHLLLD
jgi:hypothetical protein